MNLANLIRGFWDLMIGSGSRNREAVIEVAKEQFRRWVADTNVGLAAAAMHHERAVQSLDRVYTEVKSRRTEDPKATQRLADFAEHVRRAEAVYFLLVGLRDMYVARVRSLIQDESDAVVLGRPPAHPDLYGAVTGPPLATWEPTLRTMIADAAANGDEAPIRAWLAAQGVPAAWVSGRGISPPFDSWWVECEKGILARREENAAKKTNSSKAVNKELGVAPTQAMSVPSSEATTTTGETIRKTAGENPQLSSKRRKQINRRPIVFVVHGHDETTLANVEALLLRIGCDPMTFERYRRGSRTNIEILEEAIPKSDSVVALLTPDDEGRKIGATELLPRARQNVLVEAGYAVISRRESSIVVAIGGIEVPSDFDGINRVQGPRWNREMALDLARRLDKQLDLDVDLHAI